MSALVIEVHTDDVEHRTGVGKSGKEWEMWNQVVWMRKKDQPYPEKAKVSLKDKNPIPRGMYSLDPSKVIKVGNFGSMEIDDRLIQDQMNFEKPLPKETQA